jgi:AcrR family transcriptional regulator
VYRHFPSKEALSEAVITARIADLTADARARAADADPGAAFFGFLGRFAAEGPPGGTSPARSACRSR